MLPIMIHLSRQSDQIFAKAMINSSKSLKIIYQSVQKTDADERCYIHVLKVKASMVAEATRLVNIISWGKRTSIPHPHIDMRSVFRSVAA
jgi:hypothetical protein